MGGHLGADRELPETSQRQEAGGDRKADPFGEDGAHRGGQVGRRVHQQDEQKDNIPGDPGRQLHGPALAATPGLRQDRHAHQGKVARGDQDHPGRRLREQAGGEQGRPVIPTAGEVDSGSINIVFDIGSGVSDRNLTVGLCVEVTLDVTGDGLDVGRSVGVVRIVDNFITREEEKEVVVTSKHINGCEHRLEVDIVVAGVESVRACTVESNIWSVHIKSQVDASLIQHSHSLVMVLAVVDSVDTDSVDAESLELLDVAAQSLGVEQRVFCLSGTSRLVSNTTDVETLAASGVECIASGLNGRQAAALALDDLAGDAASEGSRSCGEKSGSHDYSGIIGNESSKGKRTKVEKLVKRENCMESPC